MPGLAPLTIAPMVCQLGAEPTPEAYTAHLVHVMRLARAAIRDDGVMFLNLGDSYAGNNASNGAGETRNLSTARFHGGHAHLQQRRVTACGGIPEKNLLGIPWRVAFALQADGWVLRSDVIWAKSNCMPESVRDRPTRSHEYIFLFGKGKTYYYDSAAVAEPLKETTIDRVRYGLTTQKMNVHESLARGETATVRSDKMGSRWAPNAGRNLRSVWTIPTTPSSFADGCPACYGTGIDRAALRGAHDRPRDTDAWRAWAADQPRCAACAGSGRVGEDHFAVWPPALVEIMVKASTAARACAVCGAAWGRVVENGELVSSGPNPLADKPYSNPRARKNGDIGKDGWGDLPRRERRDRGFAPRCACADDGAGRSVVLDPFAGSGTTLAVAERLGRDSIGIDLGYEQARAKRLGAVQTSMEALL